MNPYNAASAAVLRMLGAERVLASLELTPPRASSVGGVLAYGRAPLMLTERCFVRENAGCAACRSFAFTDRRGMRFPVLREYMHRNLIFNSVLTYMGDKKEELARYRISHHHFIFSDESAAEIRRVLASYQSGASLNGQVRRIGVSEAKVYDGEKGASAQEKKIEKALNKPKKAPPRNPSEQPVRGGAKKSRYPLAHEKNKPNNGKKRK